MDPGLLPGLPAHHRQSTTLRKRPRLEAKPEATQLVPSVVAPAAEAQSFEQLAGTHPATIVPYQDIGSSWIEYRLNSDALGTGCDRVVDQVGYCGLKVVTDVAKGP